MIITKTVGIVAYGAALPNWAVSLKSIGATQRANGEQVSQSLTVEQKTVPDLDEDAITLATAAGQQALSRARDTRRVELSDIQALFVGSESHPYAVKPSGTVVAQALGLSEKMAMADLQFACKAGTQGMQICASYVLSGMAKVGMAIGSDTAQAKPGDALEYTAAAGAAAYLFGSSKVLARLMATTSIASDTPDFWRRAGQAYPRHAGRFTGEPAYFKHIIQATTQLISETSLNPSEFDYCVFHTPNAKFPRIVAKKLGFTQQQLKPSLVVEKVGNTYAAAVPLALAATLDQAKAKQKILVVSYGSGAGADAFVFETTLELEKQRAGWRDLVRDIIDNLKPLDLVNYLRLRDSRSH